MKLTINNVTIDYIIYLQIDLQQNPTLMDFNSIIGTLLLRDKKEESKDLQEADPLEWDSATLLSQAIKWNIHVPDTSVFFIKQILTKAPKQLLFRVGQE